MRRAILVLVFVASLAPRAAASYDYSWALPEWRQTWSAPRLADNRGFAVEATAEAVYVAGVTGSHGAGAGDLFLLRYSRDGVLVWSRNWGGFELDQAQDIAVSGGSIWVAGSRTTADGRIDAAILRFSTEGDLLLERTWSSGVSDVAQAVSVHGDSVYVAGLTHPTRANRDLYVARLDSTGATSWELRWGGAEWDEAWDIAVDDTGVYVAGYTTEGDSQSLLLLLDHAGGVVRDERWGGAQNDEARAIARAADGIYVTGGSQSGRSTDVFLARLSASGSLEWSRTTGGRVVGGGGYGVAVGERGVYVAGGNYDFPAGGDAAILRFSAEGVLEWSQVIGLPGFWDWNFDVDTEGGRFYTAGVLWRPGAEYYSVMTLAYEEDFPVATLTGVAAKAAAGDHDGAAAAMSHFWLGDFLRWAEDRDPSGAAAARVDWEGASDYGRNYGRGWVDTSEDPAAGEENTAGSILGVGDDLRNGNYALVRDYTGLRGSLLDGFVRFRYYISHDRLIPQGGYLYVGELGVPLPPPPV